VSGSGRHLTGRTCAMLVSPASYAPTRPKLTHLRLTAWATPRALVLCLQSTRGALPTRLNESTLAVRGRELETRTLTRR